MLLQRSLEHDSRVRREAAALSEAGYSVTVLEVEATGAAIPGYKRDSVLSRRLTTKLPRRLLQPLMLVAFIVAIVRRRPEVVHAHDVLTLVPGLVGARLTGARVVYDTHELASGVWYRKGLLRTLVVALERLLIGRAALVLAVSDGIAERLESQYALAEKPLVIRNLCALRRPDPGDPPGGLRQRIGAVGRPLVLHQGSASPHRGCEALVRAVAGIPGAHLVFLGPVESGFGAHLAALAADDSTSDRVHFVPPVGLDALLSFTREADLGVCLFEPTCENYRLTLPNKVFEYIAAGVPVLASDVPELCGVVEEHGVGWIVDPSDPAELRRRLETALAEAGDRSMRDRLTAADSTFAWPNEAVRLIEAYRAICAPVASGHP